MAWDRSARHGVAVRGKITAGIRDVYDQTTADRIWDDAWTRGNGACDSELDTPSSKYR